MRNFIRSLALVAVTLVLAASPRTLAGTASIAWDPVAVSDLAGYRVYYGTSPTAYTQSIDVGNVTQTTIPGLVDCTTYYFAVKAYDTAANESTTYSNQLQGWSRPIVTSATPSVAEQGRTLSLTIAGSGFPSGATVQFANAGISVRSTAVNSCGQLVVSVTVGATATPGATSVDVMDPDRVFGTGTAVFTVQAAVAPTIASTSPADGATGASVAVAPSVTFSEAMSAASITSANVRLLDDTGAAVSQLAGSPSLSADGLTATIRPAAPLTQGKAYRIQIVGGAAGVLDLAGHGMSATTTQATGFRTVADTTPPTISTVAITGVGSTIATVTWTTDESADSQVFYRKAGVVDYQATAIDTSLVTTHTLGLAGLEASATYEYYVRSADSAGNAATSPKTTTFTTAASAFTYLRFESESGALVAPVRRVTGASDSFGGGYIDTPAGTASGSVSSPAGTATFGMNVPTAGTWYLWVRLYGPSASADSWYESVNGAARQPIAPTVPGQWQWVPGRSYALTAGLSTLEIGGFNAEARADRVVLTNDPTFTPTEQPVGDVTPPSGDTGFTAAGATAQVTLAWTNSPSADFSQSIVRFRTDGRFPVSPVDGFAVATRAGSPGTTDTLVLTGLTNGTTYSYSIFAVDNSGNIGPAATASATTVDTTSPPSVQNLRRSDTRP